MLSASFFFHVTATTEIYTFPYTTLFRSLFASGDSMTTARLVSVCENALRLDPKCTDQLAHLGSRRDRKSTRLNSSHRCISYAVFCLKKKKKKTYHALKQFKHNLQKTHI